MAAYSASARVVPEQHVNAVTIVSGGFDVYRPTPACDVDFLVHAPNADIFEHNPNIVGS